jgi:hypothetical protein
MLPLLFLIYLKALNTDFIIILAMWTSHNQRKRLRKYKDILARSWWQDDLKAYKSSCHHDLDNPYHY